LWINSLSTVKKERAKDRCKPRSREGDGGPRRKPNAFLRDLEKKLKSNMALATEAMLRVREVISVCMFFRLYWDKFLILLKG
jgi:hypothetical protein